MVNPEKYVRAAYIAAIATQTAVPVWAKKVPKNTSPVPSRYILISSQTKERTEVSKSCWEWLCSITVDIVFQGPAGYSDTEQIDDVEEAVLTAIEAGITAQGFIVKSVDLVQTSDLDAETPTQSIERRIVIYQHWLCQA